MIRNVGIFFNYSEKFVDSKKENCDAGDGTIESDLKLSSYFAGSRGFTLRALFFLSDSSKMNLLYLQTSKQK